MNEHNDAARPAEARARACYKTASPPAICTRPRCRGRYYATQIALHRARVLSGERTSKRQTLRVFHRNGESRKQQRPQRNVCNPARARVNRGRFNPRLLAATYRSAFAAGSSEHPGILSGDLCGNDSASRRTLFHCDLLRGERRKQYQPRLRRTGRFFGWWDVINKALTCRQLHVQFFMLAVPFQP